MNDLKTKELQVIYSKGFYGFLREMELNEKRYAIIRNGQVLEKIYKTKSNALSVVEKLNNKDINTIKRVSGLYNPYDNDGLQWYVIEFTKAECLQVCRGYIEDIK